MQEASSRHRSSDACVPLIDLVVSRVIGREGEAARLFERTRISNPIHTEGKFSGSVRRKAAARKPIDDSELSGGVHFAINSCNEASN